MATRIKEKTAKIRENADNRPKASVKYVRISPSKVGIVLDTVRGKAYDDAVGILMAVPNKASEVVLKLINSAAANAENNKGMNKHDLYVAEITVTQGPTLKRIGLLDAGVEGHRIDAYLAAAGNICFTRTHGRREVAFLNRAWEDVLRADWLVDREEHHQLLLGQAVNSHPCRCAGRESVASAQEHLEYWLHGVK